MKKIWEITKTIWKAVRNLIKKKESGRMLLRASVLYKKAIDEAESQFRKTGHRYYVVYDPTQKKLIPLTYDLYVMKPDSYVYLRRRGRFCRALTRNEFKEKCFYYTPSKNTTRRCIGAERREKLLKWQRYYSLCLNR